MNSPEILIIAINVLLTGTAYFVLYPAIVGNNTNKLVGFDALVTTISLCIAGTLFWNTGERFSVFVAEVNWFWFALITYGVLETPLMLGYMKKRNMNFSPND